MLRLALAGVGFFPNGVIWKGGIPPHLECIYYISLELYEPKFQVLCVNPSGTRT